MRTQVRYWTVGLFFVCLGAPLSSAAPSNNSHRETHRNASATSQHHRQTACDELVEGAVQRLSDTAEEATPFADAAVNPLRNHDTSPYLRLASAEESESQTSVTVQFGRQADQPRWRVAQRDASASESRVVESSIPPQPEPIPAEQSADSGHSTAGAKSIGPPEGEQRRILMPLQKRQLSIEVAPTSVLEEGIGTGIVPARQRFSLSEITRLPDSVSRGARFKEVRWQPTEIHHTPLYFEDVMLERHGHVRWGCFQPIVSGARFIGTIPLIPYLGTLKPPRESNYVLGHFRPGTPAPAIRQRLPWDRQAVIVETLLLGGFFWGMPF